MRVMASELEQAATIILVGLGESRQGAATVAKVLVCADSRGIRTHGCFYLRDIFQRAKASMFNLPTNPVVIKDEEATTVIDGNNGLGPPVAHQAILTSMEKARHYGVGVTLVRNTNNVGILGYYTGLAAEQGFVGVMMTNGAPCMAPWGGAEPFLGTNPISIAVPADEFPIVVDMACSVVARGKIRTALRRGEQIPLGWALDENGVPTSDPEEALKGTLIPMGGHKGSALALAVDILAGMLSGSRYGSDVRTFHALEGPTGVGFVCLAIDVQKFMDLYQFKTLMGAYVRSIKKMKRAPGFTEILMPGELEFKREWESRTVGVELGSEVVEDLNEFLSQVGSAMRVGG
ncbi:MAG: Ldh family oxidoreductase [Bacillota bacterium]